MLWFVGASQIRITSSRLSNKVKGARAKSGWMPEVCRWSFSLLGLGTACLLALYTFLRPDFRMILTEASVERKEYQVIGFGTFTDNRVDVAAESARRITRSSSSGLSANTGLERKDDEGRRFAYDDDDDDDDDGRRRSIQKKNDLVSDPALLQGANSTHSSSSSSSSLSSSTSTSTSASSTAGDVLDLRAGGRGFEEEGGGSTNEEKELAIQVEALKLAWEKVYLRRDNKDSSQDDGSQQSSLPRFSSSDNSTFPCPSSPMVLEYTKRLLMEAGKLPSAPHIQDCKALSDEYAAADRRGVNNSLPDWMRGAGLGYSAFGNQSVPEEWIDRSEELLRDSKRTIFGPYPPWVHGSDEENLVLTRRVQHDIWLHQHPRNCSDPSLKFLVIDFASNDHLGTGAQINEMMGALALAMWSGRILITHSFERANHDGCKGRNRKNWSCYFAPETSLECRLRGLYLWRRGRAWSKGSMEVATRGNVKPQWMWFPKAPRIWGEPWKVMQRTDQVEGRIVGQTRVDEVFWWRAQAIRYMMRYPSEYLCELLNQARHDSFGSVIAKEVIQSGLYNEIFSSPARSKKLISRRKLFKAPERTGTGGDADKESGRQNLPGRKLLEEEGNDWLTEVQNGGLLSDRTLQVDVWKRVRPSIPRPFVSLHVRLGDKGKEMRLAPFSEYMALAEQIRRQFPHAKFIWLSTEMQEVIEETKNYPTWTFLYTDVPRQKGSESMHEYELSIGRARSTNNAFVNLMVAAEADFFVGALGSTWCLLINQLRSTNARVLSGYLSVNRDRFWR
ncbi:hypothetical protein CBR_g34948 [Chara braunii]|uniref:Uncharacterized protein n=1 Tax=Chara braunii TaxID=69332 RepID=A0A388LK22_CHABU|nr:hypothetical protein CBR_g34948 [Chara braunii]|eukprot:GBG82572.1 hypothetical protein CBR_g34948 [Chara braunii]